MEVSDNQYLDMYIKKDICRIILNGYTDKDAEILIDKYIMFLNENYESGWYLFNVIKAGTVKQYNIKRNKVEMI